MSPRFYGFLWILLGILAAILWMGGAMAPLAVVVFGFIVFGLVFTGMMCVLPSAVAHPTVQSIKESSGVIKLRPAVATLNKPEIAGTHVHFPFALRYH